MRYLDMIGKTCPIPVIETKKMLETSVEDGILITVDNKIAVNNIEKLANRLGVDFSFLEKAENRFEVTVNATGMKLEDSENPTAPYVKPENSVESDLPLDYVHYASSSVVVISQDQMGGGSAELGKILMKGFIFSLSELQMPPTHVIFLNSGALLTAEGANTLDDLKKLEEKGSIILTCGTCSNYYKLSDKLAVGSITDMYRITEITTNAAKVVNF